MSLGTQGIFNTAVQAMNAQSQHMSNISTNIANVNTTAYKAQGSHFATLLNHVDPLSRSYFSVNTYDFRQVDRQGAIATTNRTFDVALNGRGFFITNQNTQGLGEYQFTRDGAFFGESVDLGVDSDGNGQNDQGVLLKTSTGGYVYGWAADANGVVSPANDITTLQPIMFNNNSIFESSATTNIQLQANLSAANTGRQSVGLPFVDATGASRTLGVGFTANLDSSWTLDMEAIGVDTSKIPVDFFPPTIAFDGKGGIVDPSDGKIEATIHDPAGDQTVTVDLKKLTQLADNGTLTVQNIQQDGYIMGRLNNTYFDNTGMLIGSYSNGQMRNLYQLATARFTAENNLEAKSGNLFERTVAAGDMEISAIGSQMGRTQLVIGALEHSNVDLADQFSKLIVTQRAYTSSATVLRTADEMTMAARDLKR
ncbi:MAG: flagellar hook protein FlgE [Rhodospirillaceae bacterium]